MNNQELNPEFGGRNILAAHGKVKGFFQRHFEVGALGATVSSLAVNGTELTAAELAVFGLDQPIAAGLIPYVLAAGQFITSIEFSAGGAWLFYNSDDKNQILLEQGAIDVNLPVGYTEEIGDNFVKTRVIEGNAPGSFLIYLQDRARLQGSFAEMEVLVKSTDIEIDVPFYIISCLRDGTDTGGNTQLDGNNVSLKPKKIRAGRIIENTLVNNSETIAIALENYNDTQQANIEISEIKINNFINPPAYAGIGQNYGVEFDALADEEVIHANHSVAITGGKLVLTSTGAGTSYLLWNRDFKNWIGSTTGQAYLKLGTVTATGAEVIAAKDGGANWFTAPWVEATNLEFFDTTQNGMSVAGLTKAGIKIVTTGAGIVEIEKFSFVTGQQIVENIKTPGIN